MSSFDERLDRALNQKISDLILPLFQDLSGEQEFNPDEMLKCCHNVMASQQTLLSRVEDVKKLVQALPKEEDDNEEQEDESDPNDDGGKRDRSESVRKWWDKMKLSEQQAEDYSSEVTRNMYEDLKDQWSYMLDKAFDISRDALQSGLRALGNLYRAYQLSKIADDINDCKKAIKKLRKYLNDNIPEDVATTNDIQGLSELITYEAVGLQSKILECCATTQSNLSDIMQGVSDLATNQETISDKLNTVSDTIDSMSESMSQCCKDMKDSMNALSTDLSTISEDLNDSIDNAASTLTDTIDAAKSELSDSIKQNYDGITTLLNRLGSYP